MLHGVRLLTVRPHLTSVGAAEVVQTVNMRL